MQSKLQPHQQFKPSKNLSILHEYDTVQLTKIRHNDPSNRSSSSLLPLPNRMRWIQTAAFWSSGGTTGDGGVQRQCSQSSSRAALVLGLLFFMNTIIIIIIITSLKIYIYINFIYLAYLIFTLTY